VARRYGPAVVPLGGRVLAPRCPAWRKNPTPAAAHHGGRDLTPWDTAAGACRRGVRRQMYICRKFWFDHLFFENHDKLNIKIIPSSWSLVKLVPWFVFSDRFRWYILTVVRPQYTYIMTILKFIFNSTCFNSLAVVRNRLIRFFSNFQHCTKI
jgi:hypothetical protein